MADNNIDGSRALRRTKRLGIMGGTFDPIHYGHLVAAETARCEFKLEKVLFIPTGTPPHKVGREIGPAHLRYEMVRRSIQDNPFFEVSTLEIDRQGPSYTIETIRYLHNAYPEHELYFITGSDAFREIFSWREAVEILRLTHFIGASRPGFDATDFLKATELRHPEFKEKIHFIEVPALAISSTDIRSRIRKGQSIRYLLPEAVRLFIEEHKMYLN